MRLWAESLEGAMRLGGTVVYAGLNLSPALLAVGFIIGLETALVVFLGGVIGCLVLIPTYGLLYMECRPIGRHWLRLWASGADRSGMLVLERCSLVDYGR